MAHGSKRWIVCYDGSIKRSSDRTRKDYFRDLKWRENSPWRVRSGTWKRKEFCPQCKYVAKQVITHDALYKARQAIVRAEWVKLYGDRYYIPVGKTWLYFSDYFRRHPLYPGDLWVYDWRNYVCWKCERRMEIQDGMWRQMPGKWADVSFIKKDQRRNYRNRVKGIMQRAKYNDELYEDIPIRKHDWLD